VEDTQMKEMGVVLKELRTRKGLSLVKMGEAAGVSKSAVIRIEQGKRGPSVTTLTGFARALGVRFVIDSEGMYIEDAP
jgi:transcriptional regulator with XRE-family HTH domain